MTAQFLDKKTIADQDQLDPDESFRGSGAWLDHADTGIKLKEIGVGKMLIEFAKVRSCPPQPAISVSLSTETMLVYALGEHVQELIQRWKHTHPDIHPAELERYLMSSFAAPPRTIRALVYGPAGLDNPPILGKAGKPLGPEEED